MKAKADCIPCMFKQALNTGRIVTEDPDLHLRILQELAGRIGDLSMDNTPAGISQTVYEIVADVTGNSDPYAVQKAETNEAAMAMLPGLEQVIRDSDDPLDVALHAAVAGNIIDLGIGHEFDIEQDVTRILSQDFAICDVEAFRSEMKPDRTALYLGDNAGEIVLDRLLVQQMLDAGMSVTFTVKSGPVINDATMADAESVGMTDLVPVMETGSNAIGVNWNNCSDEFRAVFEAADVVVSKGHGNFETCNDRPENIYFLLKAKCPMVADELGVQVGDIVFKRL